ncbi:hypothetical protein [Sphingomicrobium nitratireducens]|uniref:hypothetical protein n=1 Tax=Sphingomicrobium nitratireducens TaxID=2964666 RepID=UPI00223FADBA|nr:hypothetical protein [Sphingomicrobium nitratireducens]
MSISDLTRTIEHHFKEMDRAAAVNVKTDRALARADRILERADEAHGAARQARKREYERVMGDLGGRLARIGMAVGAISLITIGIGLFMPIGLFGFIAAVGLAIGVAALLAMWSPNDTVRPSPVISDDLSNAEMVSRFDSLLTRARPSLPSAARVEVDLIHAKLPDLKKALSRVEAMNEHAQEARRLMSKHLPGLIERYSHVPPSYRDAIDGEGLTVDERLVDGLKAGREALGELGEKMAQRDLAALETQGRFIKARYKGEEDL